MADIQINIPGAGEVLPIHNIDLVHIYNTELITSILHILPEIEYGKIYRMIDSSNKVITDKKTLLELGVKNRDTVSIIAIEDTYQNRKSKYLVKDAQLIVRIVNSGELIPIFELDLENETSEDLIREVEKVIDCNVHLVFDKNGDMLTNPKSFKEMGFTIGDTINVHLKHVVLSNIFVRISWTKDIIPVNEINLKKNTGLELLSTLKKNGYIPNQDICKITINDNVITENLTFENLGIKDNDEINIIQDNSNIVIDEVRLKKEFEFLQRLELHPNVKDIIKLYYLDRLNGSDYKSILDTPNNLYPYKFKVTYTMPMYIGDGLLKEDWSASFLFESPNLETIIHFDIEGENGCFKDGTKPYNNYIDDRWVDLGPIQTQQEVGLWYCIICLGGLLNQDKFMMASYNCDENRHLNVDAYRFWKNVRKMQPNNQIDWPFINEI